MNETVAALMEAEELIDVAITTMFDLCGERLARDMADQIIDERMRVLLSQRRRVIANSYSDSVH